MTTKVQKKTKAKKDTSEKTGKTSSGSLQVNHCLYGYPPVKSILLIGCGGTGGYVVGPLSKLIGIINYKRDVGNQIELFLADGDVVEEKNLARQHFIYEDIGKNKAEVMAGRYSSAFGVEINSVSKDFENLEDFEIIESTNNSFSILVIGGVDNNASRKLINQWVICDSFDASTQYHNWTGKFWVDAGNEENYGQVVCGYLPPLSGKNRINKVNPYKCGGEKCIGEFSLPCSTELYPNLLENSDKFNSQISCAERALSAPQNMQTNITAATLVMNYVNKILHNEVIKSHSVEFNIDNNFTTRLNTTQNLGVISSHRLREWEK
jgi:PRTRC genetic system ThiF family protein